MHFILLIVNIQYSKSDFKMVKKGVKQYLYGNIVSCFVVSYSAGSHSGAAKVKVDLATAECT